MTTAEPSLSRADVVEFGPFRLDQARRALTKRGRRVVVGDRALEILMVLIRHSPTVVNKRTLLAEAWPAISVDEVTVRTQLHLLRKALGDGRRYITTVSGGYCFVAPLSRPAAPAQRDSGRTGGAGTGSTAPDTNLPMRPTEIIGRQDELVELGDWLDRGRLVTVVGPGGVGKTRLVVELGWRLLETFPAGVWLIDLAPLADADALTSAVASTLGVSVTKAETAVRSIVAALGKARRLVIFDNCEHLVESAGALIQALLERAPGLSILTTSRRTLALAAEQVFGLDPLETPPAGAVEIGGFAAVELFVCRAAAADQAFGLDKGNSAAIGEICRQLDGLPLALEMAAGRLRLIGVEGLRRGLDDRLRMLKGAPRSNMRHASLHGMLEWSHSLLAPLDQALFRRIAVFAGGFSLDAAIAVTGAAEADRWTVVDALGRLIDQSLLTIERRDPVRFRLLETLRIYAAEKLGEAGETETVAERHARHFIEVFDVAESAWERTPDVEWVERYQPELDNCRVALDWALSGPQRRQAAIALAASSFILLRSLWLNGDGLRYQEQVVPLLGPDTPPRTAARLLSHASAFCLFARDPRALEFAERVAALCCELGDRVGLANALMTVAQCASWEGRHLEAENLLLEAQNLIAGLSARKIEIRLKILIGLVVRNTQGADAANHYLVEAVRLARQFKSGYEVAALFNLSVTEYELGNIDRAIEIANEALNVSSSRLENAYRGLVLTNLAAYLLAKGDLVGARPALEQAFVISAANGNLANGENLMPWAVLAGGEGRLVEAAQLVGYADADMARGRRVHQQSELPLRNRLMAMLEAGLAPAEVASCKAFGANWSGREAIEFVANRLMRAETLS